MTEEIEKLTPIQYEIVKELSIAFQRLGGGIDLQAAIGSWGDTLPQEDVLTILKHHNGN